MGAVAFLAWSRLRHRPARWLLIAAGVALATVLPVASASSAGLVAAAAPAHSLAQLPPGDRSVIVTYSRVSVTPADLAAVDGEVRRQLVALSAAAPRAQLLYRRLADPSGAGFALGAADDLASAVRLTQGRLPAQCTPTRCEVVVIGDGTPHLDPSLGVVIVGRAERANPLLLTGTFEPGRDVPLLLADGVGAAAQLASLTSFPRAFGWVAPVDLNRVTQLGVEGYLERSARVGEALGAWRSALTVTAPDATLRAADARAERSSRRFALLGGAATALLLGFAVLGAIGTRRDYAAVRALLRRRGIGRTALATLATIEAAVPVLVGTLAGLAAGAALAAWRAARGVAIDVGASLAGADGGALGQASVRVSLDAFGAALDAVRSAAPTIAATAVAAALLVAVTRSWSASTSARAAWRAVDAVVVAGIAVAALALARGAVTAGALDAHADPLLLALPVLAVVCGGLLAARMWPPLLAAASRLTSRVGGHVGSPPAEERRTLWTLASMSGYRRRLAPRSSGGVGRRGLAVRLGVVAAGRRPLRPVSTVAFLTAAVGIVVFAGAYQATLRQGAVDQAAYAVPLDARITVGTTLERPLDVARPDGYAAVAEGASAHPVLRAPAGIRVSAAETATAEVIGVDPAALPLIRAWDHVAGPLSAETAAHRIASPAGGDDGARTGMPVAAGAAGRQLAIPVGGDVALVDVTAWLRVADGREFGVALILDKGRLVGRVPADAATLYALTITEPPDIATRRQHHMGEGHTDLDAIIGTLRLGAPTVDGRAIGAWTGFAASAANVGVVKVTEEPDALLVAYQINGERVVVRSGAADPVAPVAVLADPLTASHASGGLLQLAIGGNEPVPARVVGVLDRFPTVGARFVVADVAALSAALDARDPGTGVPIELWLHAPDGSGGALTAALGRTPYDRVAVQLRADRQQQLAQDPLATSAGGLLTASALLAMLVALAALVLLVVTERRDSAAELYAWESDGVSARTLRRSLFVRAAAVVVPAVPAGLLVGLVLSRATSALVAVTALGTAPVPPLAPATGAPWVAAVLVAGVAAALLVATALTATELREPLPVVPEEDGW